MRLVVSAPVHLYRLLISPLLGPACRFAPSCSAYALEAIATHGPWRGWLLALGRLSRCHPWGGSGYDPVPPLGDFDLNLLPTLPSRGITDGTPR